MRYPTFGVIFISLDAPNPAPKYPTSNSLGQDMVHGRIWFRKKAGHFLKKSAPPKLLIQLFSRDRGRHDLFCASLCACRCHGASDRGPDRGHGPNHGRVRNARADRSVASVIVALSIMWNDPDCANIRRTRPVASVPVIMTVRRIPVAGDPHVLVIFRIGAWRANGDHLGWRRCADLNSD